MRKTSFLPYAQHDITDEDREAVMRALKGSHLTRGETVEAFESDLAKYCGAKFAVCFNSGSSALTAACFAAELTEGDQFVTSVNTFIATVVAPLQKKIVPQLVDIDPSTGNMAIDRCDWQRINAQSRGRGIVVPVHYAGIPVDVRRLERHTCNPNIRIIEDAAAALGAWEDFAEKRRVGCCHFSDLCIFSFHPAKTITTGEGGAVTTHSEALYERLKLYRNNGIPLNQFDQHAQIRAYTSVSATGNFHMNEMQAALGRSQLGRIDAIIKQKKTVIDWYLSMMHDIPHLKVLRPLHALESAPSLFVVSIDFDALSIRKQPLMDALSKAGIGSQVHYLPLYSHEIVQGDAADFPHAESFYRRALSLPLTTQMKHSDVEYICQTLRKLLKKASKGGR